MTDIMPLIAIALVIVWLAFGVIASEMGWRR